MEIDEDIPPGIGPHEGRELELMLATEKPAAMFSDVLPASFDLPDDDFAPHVAAGKIIRRYHEFPPLSGEEYGSRILLFARPGEEWRMERLLEIRLGFFRGGWRASADLEREIGRLLGYDDADIEIFIARALPRFI